MNSSARPPRHDPGDHAHIKRMAKAIEGVTGEQAMRDKLVGIFGYRSAGGWMGTEAIAIERGRAKLFDKETTHA